MGVIVLLLMGINPQTELQKTGDLYSAGLQSELGVSDMDGCHPLSAVGAA